MSTDFYLPQTQESVIGQHQLIRNEIPSFGMVGKSLNLRSGEIYQHQISSWCVSSWKRIFDLICVIPALILISPLLAIVAIVVRLTSPGPIIFRQQRTGQHRKLFTIYKFRTMVENSDAAGSGLTATGDPRITPIGHFLRRFKLDELPQLLNVLRGEMSLVGGRPKLPQLELTTMPCRPGVTGSATLLFRKEQHILRGMPANRIEEFYAQYIAPAKVQIDAEYMNSATFLTDISILWATLAGGGQHVTLENLVMHTSGLTQMPFVVEGN